MDKRNKRSFARKAGLAGMLALAGTALAACDVEAPDAVARVLGMGWPKGITPEAHAMYNFWIWVWVTAWTIGIIMWIIFLVAIFKWSGRKVDEAGKDPFPKQLQYNIPLELVLTIFPIVIVMGLFLFNVQAQQKVVALDKNPEVTVDVTAYQWNWKFGYQHIGESLSPTGKDYDGIDEERTANFEETAHDPEGMHNANPIHGKSLGDLSYLHFNDIEINAKSSAVPEIPVLVLPSHTPIEFQLASADVSHAFWVPEFLFKRDAYAHPEANQQQRAFQIESIEEEGAFVGRCAEMCGTYHSMMNFELRVVSPEKFTDYIQFRLDNPEATDAEALASIGEEPYAITTKPFETRRDNSRDGQNVIDPTSLASSK